MPQRLHTALTRPEPYLFGISTHHQSRTNYLSTTSHSSLLTSNSFTKPSSFGVVLEEREFISSLYRYGFNGQEKENEITGSSSHYDFGARIYDSRLGRFLSLDPIASYRPHTSAYSFAGNMPIWCEDSYGLVPIPRTIQVNGKTYKVILDNEKPQEFTIMKKGFLGLFRQRRTYNFMSAEGNGRKSLAIMEGQHSRKLSRFRNNPDPQKMEQEYDGTAVTFIVREILRQNTDIRLAIIGNHDVPTKDDRIEKENRTNILYTPYHLYTTCDDPDNPDCISVTEDERENGRGDKTGDDLEAEWTKERADYVKQSYFNNSGYVDTYSMRDINQNTFPGIRLSPWKADAIGITITFDFRNTVNNEGDNGGRRRNNPETREKSKTVRFL